VGLYGYAMRKLMLSTEMLVRPGARSRFIPMLNGAIDASSGFASLVAQPAGSPRLNHQCL
jgi:hypothetical protein